MKTKTILFTTIILLFMIGVMGCETKEEKSIPQVPISETSVSEGLPLEVKDISHSDCKSEAQRMPQESEEDSPVSRKEESVHFKTIDRKYLDVQHINVMFNCCPGELIANSTISNDTVTINEDETEHSCNCICKYDLKYKVGSLEYGKYHIIYKKMNRTVFEFDIDFNSNTSETIYLNTKTNSYEKF